MKKPINIPTRRRKVARKDFPLQQHNEQYEFPFCLTLSVTCAETDHSAFVHIPLTSKECLDIMRELSDAQDPPNVIDIIPNP
jgi:hypothetical protein